MPSRRSGSMSALTASSPRGSSSPRSLSRWCSCGLSDVTCCWMAVLTPRCTSGTRVACPARRKAGREAMSDVHAVCSFDGQAEPETGLAAEGAAVAPGPSRADPVHRLERPAERLRRAVAVAHREVEQVPGPGDDVRRGDRHAPPTDVLRQRHPGQRGEHPPQVVLGGPELGGDLHEVEIRGEVVLDEVDEPVEPGDHGAPFRCPPWSTRTRLDPIIAVRCDQVAPTVDPTESICTRPLA